MHHRIARTCVALAATIALGAPSASLAQGRDKAGPKYNGAAPAMRKMMAPPPPPPPPPPPLPQPPVETAMAATPAPAYAACSATVQDHCVERAIAPAGARRRPRRPR